VLVAVCYKLFLGQCNIIGMEFSPHAQIPDRLCGLVIRVLGYRSGGPVRFPALPEKKVVSLELGPLSLVSTTEELLDRKVAAPV
jgi:hypothetical protein